LYVDNIEIVKVGPIRLFKALIDQLKLVETINNNLRWDEKQWKVSPGDLLSAVILAMFHGRRTLYKLEEFYEDQDLELIFGRNDLRPEDFNDDALGRALDRFAEGDFVKILGTTFLLAKTTDNLPTGVALADTTTFRVFGEYENEVLSFEAEPFFLARGYNKEGYEEKQFKLGLATTEEGIPFFGEPLSGDMDDKTWVKTFVEAFPRLRAFLGGMDLLVVDAAAMTEDVLRMVGKEKIRLISRLPETFNLCRELKEEALRRGVWEEVAFGEDEERNADYRLQHFVRELAGGRYDFVVVESKPLMEQKAKTVERMVAKEKAALEKGLSRLGKESFATREEAEEAWRGHLARLSPVYHALTCRYEEVELRLKSHKRGRPAKDEPVVYERRWVVVPEIVLLEEKVAREKALAGLFVLFSSAGGLSPSEVLKHYKGRSSIENRFAFLKDPRIVGPVYLKLPERIKALSYLMVLALLVYSLFERRVREGLKREGKPYHVAGSYKTMRPQGKTLLEAFFAVSVLKIHGPSGVEWKLPKKINEKAQRIVRLCGFEMDIYVQPPKRAT